jgi:hypothetical protein
MTIFNKQLNQLMNYCFECTKTELEINEDIGKYWETLCNKDLFWNYKEEEQFRNTFREKFNTTAQMLDDYSFEQLKNEYEERQRKMERGEDAEPDNPIQGVHSYDILANPKYYADFCYVPVYQEGRVRADFIIDDDSDEDNDDWVCDKVRVGLNLTYLPGDVAKTFTINEKALEKK